LIAIEFPAPYVLEAYATATPGWLRVQTNAVRQYVAVAGEGVKLEADGGIMYAVDMARPEDYPWTFLPRSSEEHVNLVVFPCKSVTIMGLTDPRSYVPLSDVQVLEAGTKSAPYQYGVSVSDLAGGDPAENMATIWTKPTLRVMVTGGIGFLGRRLILVNGTREKPEGVGFVIAELRTLPSVVLQCARDMWNLTEARLKKLGRYGVENPRVRGHHEEALHWVREAEEALRRRDYAAYRTAAERGWAAAGQAYAETLGMVNDMIHGVLFYLCLLLPLAYCGERLVIGARTIQGRVSWVGVVFAGCFWVLVVVHPAFRFTLTPFLVLLAFVIVALVMTVGVLVVGRVDGLLRARKEAEVGRHEEQYRRGGVAARAVDLGIANIRRRPQRGFLTGMSVVIVTFILLSFTSLVPTVSISRLAHRRGVASYRGLLSRNRGWEALAEPLCAALRRAYERVTNAVVVARAWYYADFAGQMSVIDLSAEGGERRTTVSAVLGVEPAEGEVTEVREGIIAGRWFTNTTEGGIILSRHTAEQLGLGTNDIGRRVRIYSADFPLVGIVEAGRFDRVRDLDGEALTPVNLVMQRALRAERAVAGRGGERAATLEDYVHYSVDQVAIVPLWYALELRGAVRSVAVKLPEGANVEEEAAGYARRSNLTILGSDGERVTLYAGLSTSEMSAAWQVIIPVVLGGILMVATMMGSVYERRGEIQVYNSVGLSPHAVAMLFMAESFVYAIVGAGMGYLLGQAVAKGLHVTGLLGGLTLNYSAGGTVFVT
ncbi:MAG: ABC transporter permease, partial [bacterium]|nr:ABC transporter permease [bacterium]